MSFRTKLLAMFTLTIVLAVGLVAWIVSTFIRRAFHRLDDQRTAGLVAQFQREFARQGEDMARLIASMARADSMVQMAVDLNRPQAEYSLYVNTARELASASQVDFLEIIAADGTIVSSAQWPARFGYKEEWITQPADWTARGAFLRREELPDKVVLALEAVRPVRVAEKNLYVVGGRKLDQAFLASLTLPAGMRAMLYSNLDPNFSAQSLTDSSGAVPQGDKLRPLIERVRQQPRGQAETIAWPSDAASAETFHALPLLGRNNDLLGVWLVGSSRRELVELERRVGLLAALIGGAGILLGLLLSGWAAARVTRPVEQLAAAAREVAEGHWNTKVGVRSKDEIGQLANAFNRMTQQLVEHRDRLVQAERVAAWRELARRLAHELKNPLFPLQITVENLTRAREQNLDQFDEVFREGMATLLAELADMKKIIARFSDFAKMPAPELQPVRLNDLLRGVTKLFEAQFTAAGRPPVAPRLELDEKIETIQADPELLRRAVENLILNALDAMPAGGTLTIRTEQRDGPAPHVRLEVQDTGTGLTQDECERLFTPYYTTKQHGTGLGLAMVQSIVSDQGGKISVESAPGHGTTFRIELPRLDVTSHAPTGPSGSSG